MFGYSERGLWMIEDIHCVFMVGGFCSIYKRNSVEFLVEFLVLDKILISWFLQVFMYLFSNGLTYQYALRVLGRCSKKLGPT